MWDSQDPGATDLKVLPTGDASVVTVQFLYPGRSTPIRLSYHLSHTARGWRISDIRTPKWSLAKLLSGNP
jgi:hypothetical protein